MDYDETCAFLRERGWTVDCWSPFEISRDETGCRATGIAAEIVVLAFEADIVEIDEA